MSSFRTLSKNWVTGKEVRPLRIVGVVLKSVRNNYKTINSNLEDFAPGAVRLAEVGRTSSTESLETREKNQRKCSNFNQTLDESNFDYLNSFKQPLMEATATHVNRDEHLKSPEEQPSNSLVRSRIEYFENSISKGNSHETNGAFPKEKLRTWGPLVRERINQFEGGLCRPSTSKGTTTTYGQFHENFSDSDLDVSCQSVSKKIRNFEEGLTEKSFTKHRNEQFYFSKWMPKENDFPLVRDEEESKGVEFFSSVMKNSCVDVSIELKSMKNSQGEKGLLAEQLPNLKNKEIFSKQSNQDFNTEINNNFMWKLCEVLNISSEEKQKWCRNDNLMEIKYFNEEKDQNAQNSNFMSNLCDVLDVSLEEREIWCSKTNELLDDKSASSANSNFEDVVYRARSNINDEQYTSPTIHKYCSYEGKIKQANVEYLEDEIKYVSMVFRKEDNAKQLLNTTYTIATCEMKGMKKHPKEIESKFVVNLFETGMVGRSNGDLLKLPEGIKEFKKLSSPTSMLSASIGYKEDEDVSDPDSESTDVKNTFYDQRNADSFEDEIFFDLKKKLDCVSICMTQASKALDFCRNNAKYSVGLEIVEAQRILLITDLRRDLLRREMRKAKLGEIHPIVPTTTAQITIGDIHVPLTLTDADIYSHFFVCAVSFGEQVYATKAMQPNYKGNFVSFKEKLTLQKVPPEFEINIEIYGMKLKKKKNCETCFYSRRFYKKKSEIPSKKTIFYRDVQTRTLVEAVVPNSSFTRMGGCKVNDLSKNQTWEIDTNQRSVLNKTIRCNITVENLLINVTRTGFLNIGIETNDNITWSPARCTLEGSGLNFATRLNEASTLVLEASILKNILVCDANVCARPNALVMEVEEMDIDDESQNENNRKTRRYFLSAETAKDIKDWYNVINNVLVSLRQWQRFYKYN